MLKRLLTLMLLLTSMLSAQELRIAAASDLQSALPAIAQAFEAECHCRLIISYGSSGNFYQQLQNHAPFDVFLSADLQYPQKLQESGLTAGTPVEYASGKLVLWTRISSQIDIPKGLRSLADDRVKKVAIANPAHAPYGRAAEAALKSEGVYDRVFPKLVLGENISQAALFAQTGSADAGIIALSLALKPTMENVGRYMEIPAAEYPPIRQAAVALKDSKQLALANRFIAFLHNDRAAAILTQFGFIAK